MPSTIYTITTLFGTKVHFKVTEEGRMVRVPDVKPFKYRGKEYA